MKKILITTMLLASMVFMTPARAAFGDITFSIVQLSCLTLSTVATLNFIAGAPTGDYSATLKADVDDPSSITVDGDALTSDGTTKSFNIPSDESGGLDFNVGYDLTTLQEMGTFDDMTVPFTITPGNDLTSQTGFGSATGSLVITDEGCSSGGDDEEETSDPVDDLEEGLDSVDPPSFEAINVNDLASADQDLKVLVTYKVSAAAYAIAIGNLKEGEDITEKAKELAKKFAIKLDIKGLKKLAFKELKAAGKGKTGQEKKDAIEAAKNTGLNKLLKEIKLKLPPLPEKDGENKEEIKKIRKAKKKKILEALSVEFISVTDSGSEKCLAFKVTLPAKVCAKDDGSKTLVIAGQEINILNLEVGETLTVDLPVKVLGTFQEFFGVETAARKRKGKSGPNGKTTIPLTLTNPASE